MSVEIGIIGLSKSGKTTIFDGLTGGKGVSGGHSPRGSTSHIGVATVPDERLKMLADLLHPKKVVPAEVKYIDIGASVKELAQDKGIGGQLLNQLSAVDALINVVRAFTDESVPHPQGSVNVERDVAAMNLELTFSDLAIMERRLERIEVSLKGAKPAERPAILREQEMLIKIRAELEKDVPIREQKLTADELKALSNYQFLTAKPLLIIINIDEAQVSQAKTMEAELGSHFSRPKCRIMTACGKLEMELAQLSGEAARELRAGYGMEGTSLDRAVESSFELLELISFFTVVSDELKAWPIRKGMDAVKAAGKIHSDIEKGFIRAEVIGYRDLLKCGGYAEARKQGLVRLEGKTYIVQDGDVITFLFNV